MIIANDLSFFEQIHIVSTKDSLIHNIKQCPNKDKFKFMEDILCFEDYLYIPKRSMQLCIL